MRASERACVSRTASLAQIRAFAKLDSKVALHLRLWADVGVGLVRSCLPRGSASTWRLLVVRRALLG